MYQFTKKSGFCHHRQFEECLSMVAGLIAEHKDKNTSYLIASDFNICPIKHDDKRRSKAMCDFLKIIGGKYYVPNTPSFTAHGIGGSSSWLDGVIVSRDVDVNTVICMDDEYFPENTSTHCPVLFQITLSSSRLESKCKKVPKEDSPFHQFKKVNWENVNKDIYKRISHILVRDILNLFDDCSWQIKANAFMACLAKAAHISTEKTTNRDRNNEEKIENVKRFEI